LNRRTTGEFKPARRPPGAEVVLAARLADPDPAVAELTADRLAEAQILAPQRPLEFFHPLIGAAIREDIAQGARRVGRRRAATLVDGEGEGSLARVAAHLLVCGPAGDRWIVARLRDAALQAMDRGAPETAASYLRRALAEPPAAGERAPLLFLLGTAEWRAGEADAVPHLEQTLDLAREDPRVLIAACVLFALAYVTRDRAERAVEVLERALAAVGHRDTKLAVVERLGTIEPEPARDPRVALTIEAGVAVVGLMNERTAPAASRRAEALRGRLSTLTDPPVHLLVMLAYYAARTNRADDARELAERALACEPYPPPLDICPIRDRRANADRALRRGATSVRKPARSRPSSRRDEGDSFDPRVPGDSITRTRRARRRGGRRALGAGTRGGNP